jgi:hypothetical protein
MENVQIADKREYIVVISVHSYQKDLTVVTQYTEQQTLNIYLLHNRQSLPQINQE